MQIHFQLTKVDEKTGIVSGRAVEEVLDHAGEIFDYAKSKPHFEAWSSNISKATDGKSVGNVRAMHGKVAAGKLTDILFNDAEKAIDITAKIVDPVEKAKLLEGVYTGFSIGGSYVTKWEDPDHAGVMRYEAQPTEISIVDLPCVPTATFTAVKADGSTELRKFHPESDTEKVIAAVEGMTEAVVDAVEKSAPAADGQSTPTPTHSQTTVSEATGADPAKPDDAAKKRAAFLAKHEPAYPLLDTLRAAYGLPAVEKGMYDVADLACLIGNLGYIADCAESEAAWEGDNSAVPDALRASVRQLGSVLLDMAREEVDEIAADDEMILELAAKINELHKRGAKYSSETMKSLQSMHDTLAKMTGGDVCPQVEKVEKPAELGKVAKAVLDETTSALAKARGEIKTQLEKIDALQKRVTELEKLPAAKSPVLRVVGKGEDVSTVDAGAIDVTPVKGPDGKIDEVATKLKKIRFGGASVQK